MNLTLTYSLSEKVKNNYIDYAEQEVSFTLNWVISQDEVDTTRTVYYKPGTDEYTKLSFTVVGGQTQTFEKSFNIVSKDWITFEIGFEQVELMVQSNANTDLLTNVTIPAGTGDVWVVGETVSDTEPEG